MDYSVTLDSNAQATWLASALAGRFNSIVINVEGRTLGYKASTEEGVRIATFIEGFLCGVSAAKHLIKATLGE